LLKNSNNFYTIVKSNSWHCLFLSLLYIGFISMPCFF